MRQLITSILIILVSSHGISQNCGSVSDWSYTTASAGSGNTTYTINFDAISTSGGNKGVEDLIIFCGTTALDTNSNCYVTAPSTGTPISYSYSFTVATCSSALSLNYTGRPNNACGGTFCYSGTAGTPSSVPVSWNHIEAQCNNSNILLLWSTAQEFNNQLFEIQNRNAQGEWETIAKVLGSNTTNTITQYQKLLPLVQGELRIKQIDFDGKFDYSPIVHKDCNLHELTVTPNPTTGSFSFSEQINKLFIYSLDGKLLFENNTLARTFDRPAYLSPGLYILRYEYKGILHSRRITFL